VRPCHSAPWMSARRAVAGSGASAPAAHGSAGCACTGRIGRACGWTSGPNRRPRSRRVRWKQRWVARWPGMPLTARASIGHCEIGRLTRSSRAWSCAQNVVLRSEHVNGCTSAALMTISQTLAGHSLAANRGDPTSHHDDRLMGAGRRMSIPPNIGKYYSAVCPGHPALPDAPRWSPPEPTLPTRRTFPGSRRDRRRPVGTPVRYSYWRGTTRPRATCHSR